MKIAYLVSEYPKISHTFIRREIHALEAMGIDVLRLSVRSSNETFPDEQDQAEQAITTTILEQGLLSLLLAVLVMCVRAPVRFLQAVGCALRLAARAGPKAMYHIAYFVEGCFLAKYLTCHQAQHLHIHFASNGATVGILAHLLTGIPYSFTVHGPFDYDYAPALSIKEKVARAAFVTVVSWYGYAQLMRWSQPADWHKMHLARCGVSGDYLATEPTEPPQNVALLNVGRLHVNKGQYLLLQALSKLRVEGFTPPLTIIGEGTLRADLEAQVRVYGLQQQVTLAGNKSEADVRAALQRSTALIVPSLAENLPLVIVEAFACARPVIATQIAGIPELVEHGKNGFLVAPGDIEALASAIKQIVELSPRRRLEMGQHGRRQVQAMHNVSFAAGQLAVLFEQAIGDESSS